jgi:hypothetical protein
MATGSEWSYESRFSVEKIDVGHRRSEHNLHGGVS